MSKIKEIWDKRYGDGGDSGRGSYGDHYEFKTRIINMLIDKYQIGSVLDFGCGDGNQINELSCDDYIGMDISVEAVNICEKKYLNDVNKKFLVYDYLKYDNKYAELVMSIDVIYHIIENDVYDKYISDMINSSNKYILIYSTNWEDDKWSGHVRHRKFLDKITEHCVLLETIENELDDCPADFFLFEKK